MAGEPPPPAPASSFPLLPSPPSPRRPSGWKAAATARFRRPRCRRSGIRRPHHRQPPRHRAGLPYRVVGLLLGHGLAGPMRRCCASLPYHTADLLLGRGCGLAGPVCRHRTGLHLHVTGLLVLPHCRAAATSHRPRPHPRGRILARLGCCGLTGRCCWLSRHCATPAGRRSIGSQCREMAGRRHRKISNSSMQFCRIHHSAESVADNPICYMKR
ncbi:hypothetical protein GUJ93_ZPchr0010g9182 [Zizania palustris]|uniref:Uncharacterized protein n=1 Tax=Zizania palustris TaxID=103762 RepID=A0A8J5TMC4_ZIZPA|nr:hypothetical protein GUJ93_ZPchr0010g9182 [Zizania palustris]